MVIAYLLALVETGKEHRAAEEILKVQGVKETVITYGTWDLVIKISTDTLNELDMIITKVREIPLVQQTETLIGI
ncbi:MAG: Lrp/AsnC ligand binding domain-containing protein [Candidatus Thermoplasmatota archaeon]|nr:Lrp/AsnC ligand binding domain-containing protein [Candidatus Thermoplasmatota archaeon]